MSSRTVFLETGSAAFRLEGCQFLFCCCEEGVWPKLLHADGSPAKALVGSVIGPAGAPWFRVLRVEWYNPLGAAAGSASLPGVRVEVLAGAPEELAPGQRLECTLASPGISLAWVTLSDKGWRGQRADASGPAIDAMAREKLDIAFSRGFLLPDNADGLRALLTDLALTQGYDLVITTGGTGLAPSDVTPEATLAVIDKRLPGMERAMLQASLQKTPHAMISRAVAGSLGQSLIINLPGSLKAVRENLEAVLPALAHGLAKLQGDPSDCGQPAS